ncbi:MAG TPA: von Willebrand factor type A domain-containing protein [Chryseosolibacter sp.]
MKNIGLYLLVFFVLAGAGFDSVRTVTGKVTSADDGLPLAGVTVLLKGTATSTLTDRLGQYTIVVPSDGGILVFTRTGFAAREVRIADKNVVDVKLSKDTRTVPESVRQGKRENDRALKEATAEPGRRADYVITYESMPAVEINTEEYEGLEENIFHGAIKQPLSTFSIDVDAASYSNLRRFINNGEVPPKDAVRIEEMINYVDYDDAEPKNGQPFSIYTEIAEAPWNSKHRLVHIGLQGKRIPVQGLPPSNLVFLIDVSGSMNQPNKLPLVQSSFKLLVDQLRPQDHVAIVVYAGAAGTVLEPTAGSEKKKILAAIESLHAGGSTAGAVGLRLAYELAREHFKENGNNRVILATDGDFNVGESSNKAMEDLITEKREDGIYLSVLGYGVGNLKDSKMENLADKGNGNYAYIDNLTEARKVLVSEFGGTLFTIATDVKLQVEFNPARVQAYRLIGYENRKLNDEDFNNDRKDAGDLGSGHTVTALYEIIPVGVRSDFYSIDDLKYQPAPSLTERAHAEEWLTVKFRYKNPGEAKSNLIVKTLTGKAGTLDEASTDFRWAAAVAGFGMLLTDSQYVHEWSYADVMTVAEGARGKDTEGYRSEFLNLVRTYSLMARH